MEQIKNEKYLIELEFEQKDEANEVALQLHPKSTKYYKDCVELSISEESIYVNFPKLLKVSNQTNNIEIIKQINNLFVSLYNDELCRKWLGKE